ncbi:DUF4349 domain-containing protein [Duganella sp. FT92W]|uniref:DUF4349 domain-containing protein n=1 Tax=Pseudoduganella rivuli TaxID=2666085 RepID=A0A7X2IRY2_9BURK|nr:DUF4349 domain-containing protein [Pseudoduganella rivuli]MRV74966.1 DUF4349 domain-containing protein [Pseudoduganella rivuli]
MTKQTAPLLALALTLAACSKPERAPGAPAYAEQKVAAAARAKFLAYEHAISIDTDENNVRPLAARLVAACAADTANTCTLLQSSQSSGRDVSAHLRVRARPAGIDALMKMAAGGGDVAHQETRVDDLAKAISDSDKQLDMLRQYQRKLSELENRAGNNLETLMKVSKELAQVQAELEQAMGQNAHLLQRVNLDLLDVQISARRQRSFWAPVRDALDDFGSDLSRGISSVVTGAAYLLPWLLVGAIALALGRRLWRRRK